MGTFNTKLAGVTYDCPNGTNRQQVIRKYVKVGQRVFLVREPNNQYSPDAIGAWIVHKGFFKNTKYHIGYIANSISCRLAGEIDGGKKVTGRVKDITGGCAGASFGVNIEVNANYED
ncbi:hypothetical protein GCM10009128_12740 [Psychrosphaera haliotis]|uniref:HIRAN domain-containing protein n=1 Tax=Psychrosphaera haliotis TaxID=555083 RepID=UPI0031DFFD81